MNVLVTVASSHGATESIGGRLAHAFASAGFAVSRIAPDDVVSVDRYDLVILGSAVYAGHWLDPAQRFAHRHARGLCGRQVWLFSSGPLGEPLVPPADPVEVLPIAELLDARGHKLFAEDPDWADVSAWARLIAYNVVLVPTG